MPGVKRARRTKTTAASSGPGTASDSVSPAVTNPAGCCQDAAGKKPDEVLWVLIAHVVEGRKQPATAEKPRK